MTMVRLQTNVRIILYTPSASDPPNNGLGANQLSNIVLKTKLGDATCIRLNVAKITGKTFRVLDVTMGLAIRIVMTTGRRAPIRGVSEFVNVEPVQAFLQPSDFTFNLEWRRFRVLR